MYWVMKVCTSVAPTYKNVPAVIATIMPSMRGVAILEISTPVVTPRGPRREGGREREKERREVRNEWGEEVDVMSCRVIIGCHICHVTGHRYSLFRCLPLPCRVHLIKSNKVYSTTRCDAPLTATSSKQQSRTVRGWSSDLRALLISASCRLIVIEPITQHPSLLLPLPSILFTHLQRWRVPATSWCAPWAWMSSRRRLAVRWTLQAGGGRLKQPGVEGGGGGRWGEG